MVLWACPSLAWRGADACGQAWNLPCETATHCRSSTMDWTDDHSRQEGVPCACVLLESKPGDRRWSVLTLPVASAWRPLPAFPYLAPCLPSSVTHTHTHTHNDLPCWAMPPPRGGSQVPGHYPLYSSSSPLLWPTASQDGDAQPYSPPARA